MDELRKLEFYEAYNIFKQVGWDAYFKQLNRYDEKIAWEFAMTCHKQKATVHGITIPFTLVAMADVYGLPLIGENYFLEHPKWLADLKLMQKKFYERVEFFEIVARQGTKLTSLPSPWPLVERFII